MDIEYIQTNFGELAGVWVDLDLLFDFNLLLCLTKIQYCTLHLRKYTKNCLSLIDNQYKHFAPTTSQRNINSRVPYWNEIKENIHFWLFMTSQLYAFTHTHTWCNENRSLALYATEHMDPSTNLSNTSKLYPTSLLWWRYAYLCVQTVLLAHLQCEGWIFTKKNKNSE